jgi:sterol desaturase/sphingolipid hydroxylase (fatty acid hydroxylase superfamily)
MEFLTDLATRFFHHAENVFTTADNPNSRVFVLYLLSTVAIAYVIYRGVKRKNADGNNSFLAFLFPKKVWDHPSAWLDLRYFFFHQLVGHFAMLGLAAWFSSLGFSWITGGLTISQIAQQASLSTIADIAIATSYMCIALFISDFLGYFCHYMQHKSPLLWQFHKVHHSAEVMHPASNFREHPVDNLVYGVVIGAGYGMVMGVAVRIFGYLPSMPTLLGVPLLMLAFNLVGYNLRHSHIWMKWPGKLSMIFPSPAHHHVHHSYHPDHIDKNFAFMFPIWDVIFKTYHMPEDNRDVKFGIGEGNADELTSCLRLYWVPVRDAIRVLFVPRKSGAAFDLSKPPTLEESRKASEAARMHPAE